MVKYLDLIKDKIKNLTNGSEDTPYIEPLQVGEGGNIDDMASKRLAIKQAHLAKPRTLAEHLITGRTQETDLQNTNPETGETTLETIRTYQPSFFDNLTSGAKENFATGFASPNLTDKTGEYGKKGFGYRLGEGIGTLGRFLESPLGRGVIAYGLSNYYGDRNPMEQGLTALVGNQGNRMRDRAYRDDLIRSGKQAVMNSPEFKATNDPMARQAMLDNVESRVNSYRGYITDDVYRNMIDSQIAQENAAYRRMYYDNQAKQDELLTNLKNEQFEYQKKQDAIKNAQEWARINQLKPLSDSQVEKINTAQETIASLNELLNTYSNPKYKNAFGFSGITRAQLAKDHPIAYAPFDNEITLVRQDIDTLRQKYSKALEGGRMTDADRAFYNNVLMAQSLSYENFLEGIKRLKASEERALARSIDNYGKQGKNIENFKTQNTQQQNNSSRVRVKSPDGKVGTIPSSSLEDALNAGYTRL